MTSRTEVNRITDNTDPLQEKPGALPNERDTRPESNAPRTHQTMKQAAKDLSQGMVDTDQRGERGIDQAVNPCNVTEAPKSRHHK